VAWKAIARSVIGISHQQQQLPCQDDGSIHCLDNIVMGAVADGAGSAKYSDLGAKLAVAIALKFLASTEEWLQQRQRSWLSLPDIPSPDLVNKLFTKTLSRVIVALQKQAIANDYPVHELACTLIAFIATPDWIAAMQIGDGFMVVRCQEEKDYQLLFKPDKGEFANETTFVTSKTALDEMQVRLLTGRQQFICASTDALERVAIRLSDWTAFPPFFKPLEEYLWETPHPEADDDYLIQFLESERLNNRTNDDKTLLLCLYS
jgi:serine/threonine protein phosphatase PrpC